MNTATDARNPAYTTEYLQHNPQHADIAELAHAILGAYKTPDFFVYKFGKLVRNAYDEVIDMPRTGRWSVDALEKTEKTYIGTKVEIMVRHELGVTKGDALDTKIFDHEVDIKNTIGSNWTIPPEAVGEICLLVSGDDRRSEFSVGLIRADERYLNKTGNQDKKRGISKYGMGAIFWFVKCGSMPENFMGALDEKTRNALLAPRSGAERIRTLFRLIQMKPIHRLAVEGLARQKDPLKRVRANGGARDHLLKENLLILSDKHEHKLIQTLGLSAGITRDHFICVPKNYVISKLGQTKADRLFVKKTK